MSSVASTTEPALRTRATTAPAVVWAVLAVVIAFAGFTLQLPGLAQPLGINQGIFSAAAWGMDQGLALYRDLWDQKPPAIHLIYLLAFRLLGAVPDSVFWLDLGSSIVTGLLLAGLGARLGGRSVGFVALALWSVLSHPAIRYQVGGFLERAVPETFIGLLVPAAVLCADAARRTRPRLWQTCTGVLLGIALVFKPNSAVFWPLLVIWSATARSAREWLRAAITVSGGAAVAPLLTVLWLWQQGVARDAWIAVVEYNRVYLAVAMGDSTITLIDRFAHDVVRRMKTDPLWMSGMLATAWCFLTWWIRTSDPLSRLIPWWLGLSLLAAMAMGVRLYNAYFIACLPPLALATAWALTRPWLTRRRVEHVAAAFVLLAGVFVAMRTDSVGRISAAIRADLAHAADYVTYLERFGAYGGGGGYSARANHELIEWLRAHSRPEDRIFIFGMQAGVYFEARRLPGHRFLWVGPAVEGLLDDPDFTLERLAADLMAGRPRFIIREANNGDSLLGWRVQSKFSEPPMQAVLSSYEPVATIEDFTVYRRLAPAE